MNRIAILVAALLISSSALAADNAVIVTPGVGVTMKSFDTGSGIQAMQPRSILSTTAGAAIYGTAGTANASVITIQGIASGTVVPVSLTSTTITGTVAVTQSGAWTFSGTGTAGSAATGVVTIQGIASMTPILTTTTLVAETTKVIGTVNQGTSPWVISGAVTNAGTFATQSAITAASGSISSGAFASGSFASGALASGSIATGAMVDLLTMRGTKNAGTAAANSLLAGLVYNSTPLTLANTEQSSLQGDANGYLKVNVAAGSGSGCVGTAGTPCVTNVQNWGAGATALGAMANYGTSPGAVMVPGVNAFITGSSLGLAVASTTSGATGTLSMCGSTTGASGQINGTNAFLNCTTTGELRTAAIINSGGVASGAIASGAVASGAFASGALASGSIAAGAQVDLLTMRGTKAAGTAAANSMLVGGVYNSTVVAPSDGQQTALQLTAAGALRTRQSNQYPDTAVPYTATATGTTGATTATLAGASSVTTYLCGFSIRANATAAATGNATVTGVITATMNFTQWTAPTASGLGITEMIFTPCIPASAANTSVAVVSAAPGTGGVVSVSAWGYKL